MKKKKTPTTTTTTTSYGDTRTRVKELTRVSADSAIKVRARVRPFLSLSLGSTPWFPQFPANWSNVSASRFTPGITNDCDARIKDALARD